MQAFKGIKKVYTLDLNSYISHLNTFVPTISTTDLNSITAKMFNELACLESEILPPTERKSSILGRWEDPTVAFKLSLKQL